MERLPEEQDQQQPCFELTDVDLQWLGQKISDFESFPVKSANPKAWYKGKLLDDVPSAVKLQHFNEEQQLNTQMNTAQKVMELQHSALLPILDVDNLTKDPTNHLMYTAYPLGVTSLREDIEEGKSINATNAQVIIHQLSKLLQLAKTAGLYHGNIKSANLIKHVRCVQAQRVWTER